MIYVTPPFSECGALLLIGMLIALAIALALAHLLKPRTEGHSETGGRMKTIERSEVTNIAMTTGGERRIKNVIVGGRLMEWVGIGWIPLRRATKEDQRKYRTVKES